MEWSHITKKKLVFSIFFPFGLCPWTKSNKAAMSKEHFCKWMPCDRAQLGNVWSTQVDGKDVLEFPMQVTEEGSFWLDGCME